MGPNKNKKLIVSSESPHLYTTKRLLTEALKLKYSPEWKNPYQYLMINETRKSDKSRLQLTPSSLYFHRTTGIRYDDFDLVVSSFHQDNLNFKITNPLSSLEHFRSKDRQAIFFNRHGLSSIPTISYRGELSESSWDQIQRLSPGKQQGKQQEQKYILKMVRGNQGIGVNLVNGATSLKSLLETFNALKDQKFIIQPFVPHQKEWRVFVIKNEIVSIIERTLNKNDFRGNSKRSSGKLIKKIHSKIQDEVLRAVDLSGLDYCGVDIIANGEDFQFLEMNPVPGFEQVEELSGINIARELILKIGSIKDNQTN